MIFRFIIILFLASVCYCQTADTSLYRPARGEAADSLAAAADTVKADTSGRASDINAVIYSSGSDSLIFRVDRKQMGIYGSGQLKYKNTELKSEIINVDLNTNQIQASGVPDTSAKAGSKLKGTPVMSEAGEIYEGNSLSYNFKTQRGLISGAKNKDEGNLYGGSKVKKISPDAYFIKDGTYTTCDADTSHYFFYAREMKVILKEQIIGRWIWLYIGGVPLPVPLPFGVFPNETGRRSGIIAPAYGQNNQWGQYFSHLGYYWAVSDYLDANLLGDIYFRGGYNLTSSINYARRYALNGNVNLGYSNLKGQAKQWRIGLIHSQTINPTMSLHANLTFMSSFGYIENTTYGRNNYLNNQNIQSNALLTKTWEESGNTMSLGYSRNQSLQGTTRISETLPHLVFTKSQSYPFRRKTYNSLNSKWYEDIGYSYSGNLENQRETDTSGTTTRSGIQHNVSVSASPKIGYFSITPNINYTERWYNKLIEVDGVTRSRKTNRNDSLVTREVSRLSSVRTFSFGVGASTKLYGLLQPRALGIEAIRHVVSPSVSYSFTPDFSSPFWGYFGTYKDSAGNDVKYDKYQQNLYSGLPATEQQNINLMISNNIEMKTIKDPSDTTSEAKKIQLISFTLGTSYNFAAGVEKRLYPLNLNYHTQIANFLNLSGNALYTFYDWDYERNTESSRYLVKRPGGGLLRLLNTSIQAQVTLSAETFKSSSSKKAESPNAGMPSVNRNLRNDFTGQFMEESPDYSIPWDLSMSLAYNVNKNNPDIVQKTTSLNGNLNFNLTPSLKVAMSSSYDIDTKQFLYPEIRLFKDLHCWEMNFTWNPAGAFSGYRFEIRIKASQLKDIKLEKSYGQYQGR